MTRLKRTEMVTSPKRVLPRFGDDARSLDSSKAQRAGVTLPDGAGFQRALRTQAGKLHDSDIPDLHDLVHDGWQILRRGTTLQADGTPDFAGQIELERAGERAFLVYSDIENAICFTPGTRIAGPMGEVAVEDLRPGDRVFTRDNGTQAVRWVGQRDVTFAELQHRPHWAPVLIRKGALGDDLPERDMLVSPHHKMLIHSQNAQDMFNSRELLVQAKHLTCQKGIDRAHASRVCYIHLLFDRHELIIADGCWTESFLPSDRSMQGLSDAERDDVVRLCPELSEGAAGVAYPSARRPLTRLEAAALLV